MRAILDYSKILGISGEKYEKVLAKLDGIYISEKKEIILSETMTLPYSHRHHSHMMCIHPLHIFNYDTPENRKIIDNTLWTIERQGTGWWVGFSNAMCAQLKARAEKGNAANEKLKNVIRRV